MILKNAKFNNKIIIIKTYYNYINCNLMKLIFLK